MKKIFVSMLSVLTVAGAHLFAQKPAIVTSNEPGWRHIGHTTASFKEQNESIEVLGADEFTALKLKVKDAPLQIDRLQVFYESGDMEEINVKSQIQANTETQTFNLKHPDKDIAKVAFTYKTLANSKGTKADIDLYGLKTNQPAGKDSYRDEKNDVNRDIDKAEDNTRHNMNEASHDVDSAADRTGNSIQHAAEKTGDKISEGVNDAAAAIKDQKLDNKVGPGGETAYIDDSGQYYYINNEGKKVFISKLELKDKPHHK
jgi:hypothetical protein